jgi:hypothetical protein
VPRILNQTSQHFDDLLALTEGHWSDVRAHIDTMERLSKKIIDGRRLRKATAYSIYNYVDKLLCFCSKTNLQFLAISNTASLFLDLDNLLMPVDSKVGNPDSEPPKKVSPVRPSSPHAVTSATPAQTVTVAKPTSLAAVPATPNDPAIPNVPEATTAPDAEPTFTLAEIQTCYKNYHKHHWKLYLEANSDHPGAKELVNTSILAVDQCATFFTDHMKLYRQESQKPSKQCKTKTAGPEQKSRFSVGKTRGAVGTVKEQTTAACKANATATADKARDRDVVADKMRTEDKDGAQPGDAGQMSCFIDYTSLEKILNAANVDQRIDSATVTPEKASSSPTVRIKNKPPSPGSTSEEGDTGENSPSRKAEGAGGRRYTNMNGRERRNLMPDTWENGEESSCGSKGRGRRG